MQKVTFLFFGLVALLFSLSYCTDKETDAIVSSLDSIVFEQSSYTLVLGETIQTTVTFYPATAVANLTKEKIQIEVDNTDILETELTDFSNAKASITIVAKKAGTTNIKISAEGIDKTATKNITVNAKDDDAIPITGISLDKTELTIAKGQTATLTATISPKNTTEDKTIVWTSSAVGIATIDENGKITAVSDGEATITATSKSNSTISATCKLSIIKPITSISLDKTELSIAKGQTDTLKPTISPENTTEDKSIVWTSSNNAIATVDENGIITAIALGEATISATSKANANISASCKVKVVTPTPKITEFFFVREINPTLTYTKTSYTDTLYAKIDEEAKTITLKCAYLQEIKNFTNLKPSFSISDGAKLKVGTVDQTSEQTAVDFSSGNVDYVVTAEDGTSQSYKVSLMLDTFSYIPDANFRSWLMSNYATAIKGDSLNIKDNSVITATIISIQSQSIQDLTGIEFFEALTILQCTNNKLTELDLSKNVELTTLLCRSNSLKELDLSKNIKLTGLRCNNNALTELDLSKHVALTILNCYDNQFKTLDIRGMRTVSTLIIYHTSTTTNPIETLKVHENIETDDEIKQVKTVRGTNVKIQTYSADAGSTSYTAVCCDYDPNAGSCTTQAMNGSCP